MSDSPAYQVLARKYRPGHFRDLIGQDAMVRTLTSAFAHDRIAHAFVLTGVRGVGKTTTARIVAKGLNCDRAEAPTVDPCCACPACLAIAEGRHVDVIEMDAASNTGVDYIREINDAVRYRPAEVRYKVYIIDEVHMLSTGAFNALLKTLEEPPPHVKFILATTDIHKVPVTVLSRCQRFDLRRIEPETMIAHLTGVAEKEGARLSDEAMGLVVRAAEGSVRDALSLLDQALAHGRSDAAEEDGGEKGGEIGAEAVRAMLGLADRARVIDLFEAIMRGDAAAALAELGAQYADGADPGAVLRDLAELTHWLSVLKVSGEAGDDPTLPATERDRGRDLADRLPMRVLTRAWQMLLKSLEDLALAPNAMMAAEMAVIRLSHVADLPTPGDLVKRLTDDGGAAPSAAGPGSGAAPGPAPNGPRGGASAQLAAVPETYPRPASQPAQSQPAEVPRALLAFAALDDALAAIKPLDFKLFHEAEAFVRLVRYRPGLIEFNPAPGAPRDLANRLGQVLRSATGARWVVSVSDAEGADTIAETRHRAETAAKAALKAHPFVAAALTAFEIPEAEAEQYLTVKPLREAETAVDAQLAPGDGPDTGLFDDDKDDDDTGYDPFEEDL